MVDSKHQWKAWLYLSPAIVLLLIFTVWPIINTVRMSLLENYNGLKAAAGATFDNAVKTTCFLAEIADFAAFNEIYGKYFTSKPARSCVAVKDLPKGVLAEVEVIAEL